MNWIELWAKLEVTGTFIGLGAFIIYLICIIIDNFKK